MSILLLAFSISIVLTIIHSIWLMCFSLIFVLVAQHKVFAFLMISFGFTAGYAVTQIHLTDSPVDKLPALMYQNPVSLSGYIDSMVSEQHHRALFTLISDQVNPFHRRIRVKLSWYGERMLLQPGDFLKLKVKFKRIHKIHNLGEFNYQQWLSRHHIAAQGVALDIRRESKPIPLPLMMDRLRQQLANFIVYVNKDHVLAAILVALTTGSRHLLQAADWRVFQSTGTSHLIAISGLHVSLVAGIFLWGVGWGWRRSSWLLLKLPAQKAAVWFALGGAFLYSLLAGMSIPTIRSLVMLAVFMLAQLSGRNILLWSRLVVAFALVLGMWPLSIYSISFWLSFFAVFLLGLLSGGRLGFSRGLLKWVRHQSAMFIGLAPLTLYFFQQLSLVMMAANFVAIPYLSYIVVSACLLSTIIYFISPYCAAFVWQWTGYSLYPLWQYLNYLAHLHHSIWYHAVTHWWVLVSLLLSALLLVAPRGFPLRYLAFIFILPLFCKISSDSMPDGMIHIFSLDKGLMIYIHADQRSIIFLSGARSVAAMTLLKNYLLLHHIVSVNSVITDSPTRSKFTWLHAQRVLDCRLPVSWRWGGHQFKLGVLKRCSMSFQLSGRRVLIVNSSKNEHSSIPLTTRHSLDLLIYRTNDKISNAFIAIEKKLSIKYLVLSVRYKFNPLLLRLASDKILIHIGSQLYSTATDGSITIQFSASGQNKITTFYDYKGRQYASAK